VTCWVAFGD